MKPLMLALFVVFPVLAENVTASGFSCGPDNVKFAVKSIGRQPEAQPEPGKALVYVVEDFDHPSNEWGRPTIRVGLDGAWMGANRGTSHMSFAVDPGEHHLCTDWQSLPPWLRVHPSLTGFTAEGGRTYYFRAHVMEHHGYFTLDLDPVNVDEGKMLVATSPASDYRRKN